MKSIKSLVRVSQILLFTLALCFSALAAGEVDTSFRANLTTFGAGTVRKVAVQPDGKIVMVNTAGLVSGVFRSFLNRVNTDGTIDTSFNPPLLTSGQLDVNVIVVQPNGKILIGGNFLTATRRSLIRLNSDGSLDETFPDLIRLGSNGAGPVHDIVFYPDGRMLIAGGFALSNLPDGAQRNNLIRTDADGNVDLTFAYNEGPVRRVLLQPDGKIVRASYSGEFYNIQRHNSDGTIDNTFAFAGASNLRDMALQADGKILIASIGGEPLRRLNADGTTDSLYPAFAVNGGVNVIAPDGAGKFYIGGEFTQVSGNPAYKKVARLNGDGTLDSTFSYTAHNFPVVNDIAISTDGKVLVAGDGTHPPTVQSPLTRVNTNGSPDTSFHVPIGLNFGTGYKVLVQPDNKILVGGQFDAANGYGRPRLARLNADGTFDSGFTPPNYSGGQILDLALQPDGKIIVVGGMSGQAQRLNPNGTLDVSFGISSQNRWDVEVQSDGKILLGGVNDLLRCEPAGICSTLATVGGGTFPTIIDMAIQPDGKILIGGTFSSVNAVSINGMARLEANGTVDLTFVPQTNAQVNSIVLQSNGQILIGGNFTSVGGDPTKQYIARLNSNGSLDASFSPVLNAPVLGLKLQPDGRILVGGAFSHINGIARPRIARLNLNGSLDSSFNTGTGADSTVWSIDLQSDGKVVYGGEFVRTNGFATPGIGRLLNSFAATDTLFDYDGDGKADVSVFRPSENKWYVFRSSDSVVYQAVFAIAGDVPVPADYDGDLKTDVAIFRPSAGDWWYLASSDGTQRSVHWGSSGDIPRPSDFDGDGKADFIVFRSGENNWYRLGSTGVFSAVNFGLAGDKPLTGDFDGDGKSDVAIYRPSTGDWWWQSSIDNIQRATHFGISADTPTPADFDGDGKTDFAVYRASTGVWYILNSGNGSTTIQNFGLAEDKPVAADYDGDGRADIAVFRPSSGVWYLLRSTSGFTAMQFGISSDTPTPNSFVP